jgi:uncharacterized protein (TIGR00661 family)
MKKKILFSVLGVGLGHATRVHAILKNIGKKADYKIIASGSSFHYLKEKGYHPIEIESISLEKKQFAFDMSASLVKNIDYPISLTKNYMKISSLLDEYRPDIVFSDSEPTSFLVAMSKNQVIYSLTNHIIAVDESSRVSVTKNMENQLLLIKKMMGYVIKNSEKVFVPCFYKPKSYVRRIEYTGLILRKETAPIEERDYYLVTLGGSEFSQDALNLLYKILPNFGDKTFVVSTNKFFGNKMERKNMVMYPFLSEAYTRHCKGVITLAGYSTISEAIGYKKPVFMLPIQNHVEQFMNAHLVKRLGFGDYYYSKKGLKESAVEEKLLAFFENEKGFKEKLLSSDINNNGAEGIAEELIE